MCHTVESFAQTALLANVDYNVSLVWFEDSGFCYTISTGSSPEILLDMLLLTFGMETLRDDVDVGY